MTKKDLIYVTTIAQNRSISKAAELLYITQPSLSNALQRIEAELGTKLFKRTSEGLKPTVAGKYYIDTARQILLTYKNMETNLSWLNDMRVGRLVIGTTSLLGSIILPPVYQAFSQRYPNITLELVEDVSINIEYALLSGDIDVGICHAPVMAENITYNTLAREQFLLAVPANSSLNSMAVTSPVNGKAYLDIRLTDGATYIMTRIGQRTRQRCDHIMKKAGIKANILYQTKSIQTAAHMSGAGLGLTLIPELYASLLSQDVIPNLYYIDEAVEPYWDLAVCRARDMPMHKAAEELINICNDVLPGIYDSCLNHLNMR